MFERFTESARRVIVHAHDEARALGHGYIGTEHILLGLLLEGEGIAARALADLGVTVDAVREEVAHADHVRAEDADQQIPFTPNAKKLLELALREALNLGHNYIGTEHVLLAIVAGPDSRGARILRGFSEPDVVRTAVLGKLTGAPPRESAAAGQRSMPAAQSGASAKAGPGGEDIDFVELASLSDQDLDGLIDGLVDEQNRLLYKQGALQGQLEILRAQRNHRRRRRGGGSSPQ